MSARPRLLAKLRSFLLGRLSPADLRNCGWSEYVCEDGHLAEDPLGIFYECLLYVFTDGGRWNGSVSGLVGLLAFLAGETGRSASEEQMRVLVGLLEGFPVDHDALWEWVCDTFDPAEATDDESGEGDG